MNRFSLRRIRAASVLPAWLSSLSASLLALTLLAMASAALATMPPKESLRHGSRLTAADGTMVLYDKVIGVFIVPGQKDTFWSDDHFFHYDNGVWLIADKAAGPWELTPEAAVPDAAIERFEPPKTAVTAKLPSGRDAVYDTRLKVFKVAGEKGVFLFDGRFYRYDGIWLEGKKDDGPWTPTAFKVLPAALRRAVPAPESGQTVKLPSGDTVVYDDASKLFRVESKPNTVLFDGTFYELRGDKWFSAPGAAAGFQEMVASKVPPPVRVLSRKNGADGDKKAATTVKERKARKEAAGNDQQGKKGKAGKAGKKAGGKKRKNAGKRKKDKAADDAADGVKKTPRSTVEKE